jgi:hypothetical protein
MLQIIITSLTAGLGTQVFKFIRSSWHDQKIDWHRLNTYGGMPSAHTAFVASLITAIGIQDGINSSTFAIALIFSAIIVRDATGFRRYLGDHGRTLNKIIRVLPKKAKRHLPTSLPERIGHTPSEVFVGGCIGVLVAVLYYTLVF